MPLISSLRRAAAFVLAAAVLGEALLRRGGFGAAALRLKSDASWLVAWEDLAAEHGAFATRCLVYAGWCAVLVASIHGLRKGPVLPRAAAGAVLAAGALVAAEALLGTPFAIGRWTTPLALAAVVAALFVGRGASFDFRVRAGLAIALLGDLLHRAWAAEVRGAGRGRSGLEAAAETAALLGVAWAGFAALASPTRRRFTRRAALGTAVAALMIGAGLFREEAPNVLRQLLHAGTAGLPSGFALPLAGAALLGLVAAARLPDLFPVLFVVLVVARHPGPAPTLALLGAAAWLTGRVDGEATRPTPLLRSANS